MTSRITGAIERWIAVGLPDERVIRKAAGRASLVVIVSYGRTADIWWNENRGKLSRLENLTVLKLPTDATQALAKLSSRSMQLQCTLQEGSLMVTGENGVIQFEPVVLQGRLHTDKAWQ